MTSVSPGRSSSSTRAMAVMPVVVDTPWRQPAMAVMTCSNSVELGLALRV